LGLAAAEALPLDESMPRAAKKSLPALERALIYLGPASISLVIVRMRDGAVTEWLEHLNRPLPLARDIFRTRSVSRSVMEQAVGILADFGQTLREYGLDHSAVQLCATNILTEASSPEIFLNRLQVAAGCTVTLLDEGDMTRLIYITAQRMLKLNPLLAKGATLVSHIGPGNTRAFLFRKGRVVHYASYRLGIFRAQEAMHGAEDQEAPRQLTHLEEQIRGVVDHLGDDFSGVTVDHHAAIGAELQSVAPSLAQPEHGVCSITEKQLASYVQELAVLTPAALVRKLSIHYTGSEGVLPALQTNLALARKFGDEVIHVAASDFHRDLLQNLLSDTPLTDTFQEDVIVSAWEVAKKFKVDRQHAEHVMNLAQQIFRHMASRHGLDAKHELLLRVACVLHEVGMYVSAREHHKHSMYLILNTELFGISTTDRVLVALLARYHRRYNPEPNHPHFSDMTREERMVVFKLAAILRLADALDRTHSRRIKTVTLKDSGSRLILHTPDVSDVTVEQIAIQGKCDLFREIYGLEPSLLTGDV
jgi:exopolyphosphatase / guanosine-5'-triphosphate,3'-diphosphate pyrophosphatase